MNCIFQRGRTGSERLFDKRGAAAQLFDAVVPGVRAGGIAGNPGHAGPTGGGDRLWAVERLCDQLFGIGGGKFSGVSAGARLAKVIELLTANSPKANKLLNSVRNSKNPWFYTILAFITPGLPNGIIPYAAAHANMKPKQFFAAICISMPIPTLLTCLAGSYLVTGDWLFTVLIEGGMFAVVGLLFHKRSAVIGHAHEVKDRHTR